MSKKIWYVCLTIGSKMYIQHCPTKADAEKLHNRIKVHNHPNRYGVFTYIDFIWAQDYNQHGFYYCHGMGTTESNNLLFLLGIE